MTRRSELDDWLAVGDLDELLREVDRLCEASDWEEVESLRRRARSAIERGHQLWPAASYAEYRLALEAPAAWAAAVVHEGAGWMAPGPLTEVVAQNHSFAQLSGELEHGPTRATVAAERVIRGEACDLGHPDDTLPGGIPARLSDWEPDYQLAVYRPDGADFDPPALVEPNEVLAAPFDVQPDPDAADGAECLTDAVKHWSSQSEATVRASGVVGDRTDALGALGVTEARWRSASLGEAGALLAWAASDGAAHGRRRGAAAGRFELWWTLAVLCGIEGEWPCDPGPDASELRYGLWLPVEAVTGWSCRITVEDPLDGLAWALDAHDAAVVAGP